jgi:hypothetical protein
VSLRRPLNRRLYELLPALYVAAGGAALYAGYRLRDSPGDASVLLSASGLAAVLFGLVVWLRRRDFRRLRQDYRSED